MITALSTKGRSSKAMWVEEYQIEYSDDDISWSKYSESGYPKVNASSFFFFKASLGMIL